MRRLLSMLLAVIATLAPAVASVAAPMKAPGRATVEARASAPARSSPEGGNALGLRVFLQRDPNGYEDSVNQYAYGANDPINHRDPTGEAGEPGERMAGIFTGLEMSEEHAEQLVEAELYRCQMLWGLSRDVCASIPSDYASGIAVGSALKGLTPADIQNAVAAHVDTVKGVLGAAGLQSVAAIVPIVPRARTSGGQAWRDMLGSVLDDRPAPEMSVDPAKLASQIPDRPVSSPFYSNWYDAKLTKDVHYPAPEDVHFREANRQLRESMRADPAFAEALERAHPGIGEFLEPGPRGAIPSMTPARVGLTWHHSAQREGVLELVPVVHHQSPGVVQKTLHPNRKGGMQLWGGKRSRYR